MKSLYNIILILLAAVVFTCCKKSDYLQDGGVHTPNTPLSAFDYLNQHPGKLFDTLCVIIDKLDMKNEVNTAGTFFVPTDYAIKRFIDTKKLRRDENIPYTLDTLVKEISRDSLAQYLFKENVSLGTAPTTSTPITSVTNEVFDYRKVLQPRAGESWSGAEVYYLYLTKIKGSRDVVGVPPPPNQTDIAVQCQTTGIVTSSGTTINVLSNNHFFIRF
ncbi:hypothetical protein [Desertivirga arenae]|uniref:hypothetical protein n=1 Tax=Desertivirga arenae TaxID=2810309 RepID=UPI001A95CA8F|nr:hypothetical protein [Pedobacter sp. SYSU D00823]